MRFIIIALLITVSVAAFGYYYWYKPKFKPSKVSHSINEHSATSATTVKLKAKGNEAKLFAKNKGFNEEYCFLIDMSIHSGNNRFFVYNMLADTIESVGLVTHGGGNGSTNGNISFSNEPNSNCTSLGKYKIANSYYGKFGLAYKLHGLEASNNNAFKRFVVLHSHSCVPDNAINPLSICTSLGCPTVSPAFLDEIKKIIDNSKKPVLLWIYK